MEDHLRLERARRGDQRALEDLLREHLPKTYPTLLRMLGSRPDADDALQETSIRIVRNLHKFDEKSSFSTWIHRIAINCALDEIRRRQLRPQPVEVLPELHETAGQGPVDDRITAHSMLSQLGVEFRSVFVLREFAGLEYDEIAQCLDLPIGTVRSRLARARRHLLDISRNEGTKSDDRNVLPTKGDA